MTDRKADDLITAINNLTEQVMYLKKNICESEKDNPGSSI